MSLTSTSTATSSVTTAPGHKNLNMKLVVGRLKFSSGSCDRRALVVSTLRGLFDQGQSLSKIW